MKKNKLRKVMASLLGIAALSTVSAQSHAFDYNPSVSLGTFTGSTITWNDATPYKSWSDYGAGVNFGWTHSADWYQLQVGSAADIAAGNTYNVQLSLTGTGTSQPLNTGGFSIWTSGSTPMVDGTGGHEYNQVRGPHDGAGTTNDFMGADGGGNIVNGHDGWVGYSQNGLSFTNEDGDSVAHGGAVNGSSPYLTGGSASVSSGNTSLTLNGLKSGYYLIGLGGVCPDDSTTCMNPAIASRQYSLSITAAVPEPEEWALMLGGLALIGWRFSVRQKPEQTVSFVGAFA